MGSTISELLKKMNTSKKLIIFCYLIFTPAVFSKALPEPQNFDNLLQERTVDIPDNVLEVAAVGFLAGLILSRCYKYPCHNIRHSQHKHSFSLAEFCSQISGCETTKNSTESKN